MTKSQEIKHFLEDFISLCQALMYATPDDEYYELAKKSIRAFKAEHKGIWAEAFIALLRADVEEDLASASDPRGITGAVWNTMEKVCTMVDRCRWEEDAK